eukprot:CAMPEP_0116063916 /NCGR_PEP_ID=MMETSP0322-20121206/8746_1 /TAXON_ID=163516 /ORGANISM="Leptocylindrus danicus var. apora, Strain B651" /LENGTH=313 /DNA_ID=CAMNT_0003549719 /DNA_START=148 /DNA_END=1089 /DNA_ORIENTATION=+
MSKSPALRRIQADVRELKFNPSPRYFAAPLEDDMFEWHFTIRGPRDTEFEGGVYHGRILLPPEYPFKPPNIMFLNQSGRFEVNTKVCLSFTAHHAELWQPAWGIRLILEALISFLPSPADGAIGALNWTAEERKKLAKASSEYCCARCGNIAALLRNGTEEKEEKVSSLSSEIEKLHMLQRTHHSNNDTGKSDAESSVTNQEDDSSPKNKKDVCSSTNLENETMVENLSLGADIRETPTTAETIAAIHVAAIDVAENNGQQQADTMDELSMENYVPEWLTDPVLNVLLVTSVAVVVLLAKNIQDLTLELNNIN